MNSLYYVRDHWLQLRFTLRKTKSDEIFVHFSPHLSQIKINCCPSSHNALPFSTLTCLRRKYARVQTNRYKQTSTEKVKLRTHLPEYFITSPLMQIQNTTCDWPVKRSIDKYLSRNPGLVRRCLKVVFVVPLLTKGGKISTLPHTYMYFVTQTLLFLKQVGMTVMRV